MVQLELRNNLKIETKHAFKFFHKNGNVYYTFQILFFLKKLNKNHASTKDYPTKDSILRPKCFSLKIFLHIF